MGHDAIIVGARCAGSALGALLARQGVRVLMLDAARQPSDMPMSTHFMQPPCMDVLDELGVGDRVRECTPASQVGRYRMETHDVYSPFPDGRPGYCTRRSVIDPLVQEAATAAGAELRDGQRVVELLRDGERVMGVVVEARDGRRERISAGLVVGADGRKSTVARLTGVETYLTFPFRRGAYWFYFPTPKLWREDAAYRDWDGGVLWEGDGLRYIFQCDGDLLLMAVVPPNEEARTWGSDYKQKSVEYLRASEVTRPLVEATEPVGKGVALLKAEFFYRRPVGPGFALVGDAGNFKDFVTGHGMADAFLGAKRLSRAILDGSEAAYERYWRERDAETLPLYFDAIRMGEVEFNSPFAQQLFDRVKRSKELSTRFGLVADRKLHPFAAFSMPELLGVTLSGLLRGRFDVLGSFLATGKRMRGFEEEISRRQALLDALPPPAPGPAPPARVAA